MNIKTETENEILIVIPVYKSELQLEEMNYFNHNCDILKNYHITLVAPNGLNINNYTKNKRVGTEFFPAHYFKNIAGYNQLMLSETFYKRFEMYKYILICQTDVFVFKDELKNWCNKDYDYVGAPWINKPFFLFQYVLAKMGLIYAFRLFFNHNIFEAVGNGGFSLRKVSAFIEVLNNNLNAKKWLANEDFYWSFFAKNKGNYLKKPSAKEASLFCIEMSPKKLLKRQNYNLPMGIHAWERYKPEFWKPYINNTLSNTKQ